ncbi:MAG: hypothetical protein KC561_15060, partial [Myxococcales bacterium]|nr:hypothetical protein [Myxococcales bacterium]
MPLGTGLDFLPGLILLAIALMVSWILRRPWRLALGTAAQPLGLEVRTGPLGTASAHGYIDDLWVEIDRPGVLQGTLNSYTRIRVAPRNEVPIDIYRKTAMAQLRSAMLGELIETGDPDLDDAAEIRGDPACAATMLQKECRDELVGILLAPEKVSVKAGTLIWVQMDSVRSPASGKELLDSAQSLINVARAMHSGSAEDRLESGVKTDP